MRGHRLHAPAHLDAEALSALGLLHRANDSSTPSTELTATLDHAILITTDARLARAEPRAELIGIATRPG